MENWLGQILAIVLVVAVGVALHVTLGDGYVAIWILVAICTFVSIVEFMPSASRFRWRSRRREP